MFNGTLPDLALGRFIARWGTVPIAAADQSAWEVVANISAMIRKALTRLARDFRIEGEVAIHREAVIEPGAIIKGPAIIGARSFVAASAYLRGGIFLDEGCTIGPGCELKSA